MLKKLNKNFFNSLNGLKHALEESSFLIELLMGVFFFPYLILVENPVEMKMLAIFSYFFMLILELVNTAIERICNRITLNYDEQVKIVKDIASASVFMGVILFFINIIILLF